MTDWKDRAETAERELARVKIATFEAAIRDAYEKTDLPLRQRMASILRALAELVAADIPAETLRDAMSRWQAFAEGVSGVTMPEPAYAYVRHSHSGSLPRRFTTAADDPVVGTPCPACNETIRENDSTALVPLGPGTSVEARNLARARRAYNAVAIVVHYACATGEESP